MNVHLPLRIADSYPSGSMRLPVCMLKINVDSRNHTQRYFYSESVASGPETTLLWNTKHKTTAISWLVITQWLLNIRLETAPPTKPQQRGGFPAPGRSRKSMVSDFPHSSNTHSHKELVLLTRFYFWSVSNAEKQLGLLQKLSWLQKCQELPHKGQRRQRWMRQI